MVPCEGLPYPKSVSSKPDRLPARIPTGLHPSQHACFLAPNVERPTSAEFASSSSRSRSYEQGAQRIAAPTSSFARVKTPVLSIVASSGGWSLGRASLIYVECAAAPAICSKIARSLGTSSVLESTLCTKRHLAPHSIPEPAATSSFRTLKFGR